MSNVYLEQASRGLNQPWRYGLTVVLLGLAVLLFNIPYSALVFLVARHAEGTEFRFEPATGVVESMPFPLFAAGMLLFAVLIATLAFCVRYLHGRPFSSLLGQDGGFRLGTAVKATAGAFAVLTVATGVNVLIDRGSFLMNFDAARFVPAVLLVLVLVPIQAAAEELLFRGWLMQGLYRLIPRPWVAVVGSSLLFWGAHLSNPDPAGAPWGAAVYYLALGCLLAWLTLRAGRLEVAIGVHAGVNLCAFLVAAAKTTTFQPVSLFIDVRPDPLRDLVLVAVLAGSAFMMLRRRKRGTRLRVLEAR